MGDEDRYLRGGGHGHLHGAHHPNHLWTMVSREEDSSFLTISSVLIRALCSDLVYVILFPQLLCVVHFPEWCNTYGSLFSYCLGLTIRLISDENSRF